MDTGISGSDGLRVASSGFPNPIELRAEPANILSVWGRNYPLRDQLRDSCDTLQAKQTAQGRVELVVMLELMWV